MMTAIAVCNNVTPVTDDKDQLSTGNTPVLQASSPDEVALVKFAWSMRMKLKERERT